MSQNNGMICNFKTINDKITKIQEQIGSGVIPQTMVEITYSELKSLRDNGQLAPGCWYRITDYETTTSQYNTQSAGHLFDIIVLALDNKTLSEEAFACHSERDIKLQGMKMVTVNGSEQHVNNLIRKSYLDGEYEGEVYYAFTIENNTNVGFYLKSLEEEPTTSTVFIFLSDGTPTTIQGNPTSVVSLSEFASQSGFTVEITDIVHGYFAFSKLEAWKIWYCLDNDASRFMWAKLSDGEKRVYPNFEGPTGRRDERHDMSEYGLCAWRFVDRETYYLYTFNDNPKIGDHFIASVAPAGIVVSASSESITLEGGFTYTRNSSYDCEGHFGWKVTEATGTDLIYTDTENPTTTSTIYGASSSQYIADISWNGKGIIYRMIDEWGNDCPYDFKNIQHILPIKDWMVDSSGTDKPCYIFDGIGDCSITGEASNNVIGSYCESGVYKLPVIRMGAGNGNRIGANCNRIYLGAMQGANVCQFVTDVDYQTGGKDDYHHYEWFGRARNGSVVQTNLFGTAT